MFVDCRIRSPNRCPYLCHAVPYTQTLHQRSQRRSGEGKFLTIFVVEAQLLSRTFWAEQWVNRDYPNDVVSVGNKRYILMFDALM